MIHNYIYNCVVGIRVKYKKNKVWKILIIIQRKRTLKSFFPHEGLFRG